MQKARVTHRKALSDLLRNTDREERALWSRLLCLGNDHFLLWFLCVELTDVTTVSSPSKLFYSEHKSKISMSFILKLLDGFTWNLSSLQRNGLV